ncbi:hypothetical protein [Streptomyces sp. NPDC057363]|uniref:hypothetical protein n=1 Tax=Streptomyces sp. NPDC057363 TaxID=3346107 RepID=UPI0036381EB5
MNTSHRRTTTHWIAVAVLAAIALTGCSQKPADRMESAADANTASPSDSADRTNALPDDGKKSADPAEAAKKASPSTPAGDSGSRADDGRNSAGPATVAKTQPPSPRTDTRSDSGGEAAKDAPASTGRAPFAGTEQFVTIDRAWTSNGRSYVSVRPAEKKINTQFDTWEINSGTGPFTTVPMAGDARTLLTVPVRTETAEAKDAELLPYSPARFVTLVNRLDSSLYDGIGYDLVFDGAGQVTSLKTLFRP